MKITDKKVLAETEDTRVTRIEVEAPLISRKAKPGQFVVLIVNEKGERIPLTVVDANKDSGIITLIFQELGLTTKLLGKLNVGDSLYALTGPLGHATEIKKYGKVILVGGGVGIAEIYPAAKALKNSGNSVTTIIGARTKELLILEKELEEISDEFFVTTDDGSKGRKGFVTDVLKEIVSDRVPPPRWNNGSTGAVERLVYAVGPIPMMKAVSSVTKKFGIKTLVSLNSLMIDATGMCGGCRVRVKDEARFTCVDGPEFDAHGVDWEELENRSRIYLEKEKHICRLHNL
jgi:ferredoxin--NADP+ reductase